MTFPRFHGHFPIGVPPCIGVEKRPRTFLLTLE